MAEELLLSFPSGDTLKANEIALIRELGRPLRWRFNVSLPHGQYSTQRDKQTEERVKNALLGGPCKVKPMHGSDGGTSDLGQPAKVVAVNRTEENLRIRTFDQQRAVQEVEIWADATGVSTNPDPFVPRRKVHKVRNIKELIDRFSHVAKPAGGALQAELARVTFPDADHASIIQDGVSDWTFLHQIFDECRWLTPQGRWLPLTLIGGANEAEGTYGRWIIAPGIMTAYQDWGTVEQRTLHYGGTDVDGYPQVEFGTIETDERVIDYPTGQYPCGVERRPQRSFDAGRWKAWRQKDLPCFTEAGQMVVRIVDRLNVSNAAVEWDSACYAVPKQARVGAPERLGRLRPWTGLGTVDESKRDGPWLKVKLPGFESGNDIADVRLGTPYSGKNGKRGLHMIPEQGTEVLLAWNGRFDSSIILPANARSAAAEYPSPSTWLEDEHTAQYANIHVVKIGDTTIDSRFGMSVKQSTDIRSQQPLQVKADGADLKMNGGIVHTGRGF